jgi:hypothetical protein
MRLGYSPEVAVRFRAKRGREEAFGETSQNCTTGGID